MGIKVITPPTITSVISDADLRTHLRIIAGEEELMAVYRLAAHRAAEHYTGYAIGAQVLELALDAFPEDEIQLPGGKVTSITSITYKDTAGANQTLPGTDYVLDDYSSPPRVVPAADVTWPTSTQDVANAVKVRYAAGDVPDAAKAAILLTTAHLYQNREAVTTGAMVELPLGVRHLLDTIRVYGT